MGVSSSGLDGRLACGELYLPLCLGWNISIYLFELGTIPVGQISGQIVSCQWLPANIYCVGEIQKQNQNIGNLVIFPQGDPVQTPYREVTI